MRKTKIVCTLGPESESEEMIKKLLLEGMNVARLNFSHESHEYHKRLIERVKKAREELKLPAAIMLDTKGPEIRIKSFKKSPVLLEKGQRFTLTVRDITGDNKIVSVTYDKLPSKIKKGDKILLDDGNIILEAVNVSESAVECEVLFGGKLSNNKGINVPKIKLDIPYLSQKDIEDIIFGIENDVDFIAASFVRTKQDVIALRKLLDYNSGHNIRIISKIENSEGIENFDEILAYSDGIMIARGDMGVEVDYECLPGIQKRFIKKCYQSGKMVITATQILESMIYNTSPTRAEITDVANAVIDGTSAIMLSGETAIGTHPDHAVRVMSKIAMQAEKDAFEIDAYKKIDYDIDINDTTNAICDAANTTAKDLNAKAIVVVTKSGETARRMSKFRPHQPIVGATPETKTFHQLSLSWGVYPVIARYQRSSDELLVHAIDCAKQIDIVSSGDRVIIVAGTPIDTSGSTNLLKVQRV